ncbi:hypothetical protein [Streptomyces sp. A30]|uniref:hypothetical protein n=1 Tax=Streptomyces sp. A30 TaxID=2789273 RepID=UPI0039811015
MAIPADSLNYWPDRLTKHDIVVTNTDVFGKRRLAFAHPCGIRYVLVPVEGERREGRTGGGVPGEYAIHGAGRGRAWPSR